MKIKFILILTLLLFLNSSCATEAVWKNTNPDKFVKINFTQITEEELIENGVKYIKDNERKAFYVEKNSFAKLKDYTYRVLGTPVTLVIDTITIVVVAAAVAGYIYLDANRFKPIPPPQVKLNYPLPQVEVY